MTSSPPAPHYGSASCGREKQPPTICARCHRPVHVRTLLCHEGDAQVDATEPEGGSCLCVRTFEGALVCLHCAWVDCSPALTLAHALCDEEDEGMAEEDVEDAFAQWMACWREQEDLYIDPASRGGGSSGGGRFKKKNVGTKIKKDDWTGFE